MTSANPLPLVIDTDTAQDDCIAILVGLLHPEVDLKGITMVAGNVGFDRQVANAFMTLSAAGRLGEVPVHLGCRRPLARPWISAENVHGDGSGGLHMDFSSCEPAEEHGVDALCRLAREHAGELVIVCIAPLTNIAMAVARDPQFVTNVGRLVIMGGSNNGRGNITAAGEFNFYVDPEAAKAVFAAGFDDITVVPWAPLTLRDAVFSRDQLARIGEIGTPLARFFRQVCDATLEFDESVGIPGTTHPDSLSASIVVRPELVTATARYHVDVEASSNLTRGYSAMSWGVHGLTPNATVVESVDAGAFFDHICRMLAIPVTASRPLKNLR
jgi:purine nucleosidase